MATTSTITLTKELDPVGRRKLARLRAKEAKMEAQELVKQQTFFDLETMDDVTLRKVGSFKPVETAQEALARLGNDTAKFLKVVNDGLRSDALRNLATDDSIAWQEVDEETGELKPFTGSPADAKVVNPLVLTLAKTIYKYNKDMKPEEKKAAKEAAKTMIRTNPAMVAGLKESAKTVAADE